MWYAELVIKTVQMYQVQMNSNFGPKFALLKYMCCLLKYNKNELSPNTTYRVKQNIIFAYKKIIFQKRNCLYLVADDLKSFSSVARSPPHWMKRNAQPQKLNLKYFNNIRILRVGISLLFYKDTFSSMQTNYQSFSTRNVKILI